MFPSNEKRGDQSLPGDDQNQDPNKAVNAQDRAQDGKSGSLMQAKLPQEINYQPQKRFKPDPFSASNDFKQENKSENQAPKIQTS